MSREDCYTEMRKTMRDEVKVVIMRAWLNNGNGVYGVLGFLAYYWLAGFGTFLQAPVLASYWPEDCANFAPTPEEN
jgi:hypothetical protein